MRIARRVLLASVLAAPAVAQGWPARPVRLVVPFPPGGPADVIGRLVAERLAEVWGQPVVIDNRGGAGGNLGAEHVARAAPDGYTLLLPASSHVQGASLYRSLPFHPVRDFTAIAMVAYYGLVVVVHPSVRATTLAELEALARAQPGALTVTSAGVGTPTHLTAELWRIRSGVDFTHVPFQGAAPAHTALLSGQVQAMFNNPVLAVPAVRAGSLRALATTGPRRSAQLPDLPTVAESYPDFEGGTWYGVLGPAGMAPAVVAKIDADVRRVLAMPAVRERLAAQGLEVLEAGPEEFAARMASDYDRWAQVVRQAGIRPE